MSALSDAVRLAGVVGASPAPGPGSESAALGRRWWRRALARRPARIGLVILVVIGAASIAAPLIVSLLGLPGPDHQAGGLLNGFGNPIGPTLAHPLGADPLGRDVLSRLLYGGRGSLAAAIGATLISVVLGLLVGTVAGYFGGWIDAILSRAIEVGLCFPVLFLALGLSAACSTDAGCLGGSLHPGVVLVTLVMGLSCWPYPARVVRAQARALQGREFVQAARCAGVGHRAIIVRDLLPNLTGPVIVFVAYALPGNLLFEAGLAYVGVGVPSPTPTWGSMLADATANFPATWWYFLAPAVAISVTAVAFNLVAEGVGEALDPHRR